MAGKLAHGASRHRFAIDAQAVDEQRSLISPQFQVQCQTT
jgi:hypothetical protein